MSRSRGLRSLSAKSQSPSYKRRNDHVNKKRAGSVMQIPARKLLARFSRRSAYEQPLTAPQFRHL
jgi:hypothetical protein